MIESTILSSAFISLLGLILLFLLFYWAWQQYVIDVTRQRLFELRDQLFDMATQGTLQRDSETYRTLRKMFNATIRFTHEMDWVHFLTYLLTMKWLKNGEVMRGALRVEHLVNNIADTHAKRQIEEILVQMHRTIAWHIFRRSLILIMLLPLIALASVFCLAALQFPGRAKQKFKALINAKAYSEATS